MLLMQFFEISDNAGVLCQALMIFSINSVLLVMIFSFAISFFNAAHTFSIGFRSGEFPGQSRTEILLSCRNLVTFFALWHGAESCINTNSWFPNQSLACRSNLSWSTCKYWSWRMVPLTIWRRPFPLQLMTPQIMTDKGCFTLSTIQSLWNFSSGLLRTNCVQSCKIWIELSSEKQTWEKQSVPNGHAKSL